MNSDDIRVRLKNVALRVIRMVNSMPHSISADAIARQIVRSGTSPSANYRAALLAKSDKDFLNKLKMVEEELDETLHWLEIIAESEMLPKERLDNLHQECHELLKIIVATITTLRKKNTADFDL